MLDTVSHALIGLTTYGAVNKEHKDSATRASMLAAAIIGSQIPDIDMVIKLTETGRIMYRMWHRGITHSLFLAPLWALLIYGFCYLIWRRRDKMIYILALLNVVLHKVFDSLNTWGTGLLEPFSSARFSFGIIPLMDVVILSLIFIGLVLTVKPWPRHLIWRGVWVGIVLHLLVQGTQGYIIYSRANADYQQAVLTASYTPWHFNVIGKTDNVVEVSRATVWGGREHLATLISRDEENLEPLLDSNPRARVLKEWAPFVVIKRDGNRVQIIDPRFYKNGRSNIYEELE